MEEKKIAIITGASSGMGKEFARQLDAMPGAEINEMWLIARREDRLAALAEELHTACRTLAYDITEPEFYTDLAALLQAEKPNIRYLVQSAGFGKMGSVETVGTENDRMAELNCLALTKVQTLCLPYMQKGSAILNIASVASFMPQYRFATYAATKAYVLSLSRALHRELKPKGITVTAVCPNPMHTEFFEVAGTTGDSVGLKKMAFEPVEGVTRKALRRAAKGKDISIYGFMAHVVQFISRVFPHNFVLWCETKMGF